MSPATATQDEDLLIISEDTPDTASDMDFSFHFGDETPASGETSSQIVTPTQDTTQAVAETASSLGDFSFDIFEEKTGVPTPAETSIETSVSHPIENTGELTSFIDTPEVETPVMETSIVEAPVVEEIMQEAVIAQAPILAQETPVIDQVSPILEEENVSATQTGESLNDILSLTILKLQARQEVISADKASKTSKEEAIKEKIKELQAEVKFLEAEMEFLDSEAEKITANVQQLEAMKLDPVKEHNARRIVKK